MSAIDDRFERELDAWWNEEVSNLPHSPRPSLPAADLVLIRDLHASHAPAAPSPAFAQSLREQLMNQAQQPGPAQVSSTPRSVSWRQQSEQSRQFPNRAVPRRRGPAWLQFAVAAALILGLVGAAYGGDMFGRFSDDQPTAIPAALGSNGATATLPPQNQASGPIDVRGGVSRSGQMPGPFPTGAPNLIWKKPLDVSPQTPLVADAERVFALTTPEHPENPQFPNALIALDLNSGDTAWTAHLAASPEAPLAVGSGIVVAATTQGLVAFDETSGKIAWSHSIPGAIHGIAPVAIADRVYVAAGDGFVRALNLANGTEEWKGRIPKWRDDMNGVLPGVSLAVAGGTVYGVDQIGTVFALDARNGQVAWTFDALGEIGQPPVVDGGRVFVASIVASQGAQGTPGRLYGLDAATGKQLWVPKTIGSSFTMAAADDLVFIASATPDGAPLTAFDAATGKQAWSTDKSGDGFAPIIVSEKIVFSGADGSIHAAGAKNGSPYPSWSVFLNWIGDPLVTHGLVIASGYGTVFAVGGIDEPGADAHADFSGLPPCSSPAPAPTHALTGTPATSIGVETELKARAGNGPVWEDGRPSYFTEYPQLLTENVPSGPTASQSQVDAIKSTFEAMGNCSQRADGQRALQGFFTSDFFRRGVAKAGDNGYALTWQYQPEQKELETMTTIVLKDGRVAAEFHAQSDNAPYLLVIFRQQDGHWLIDEVYKIVGQYNWGTLG